MKSDKFLLRYIAFWFKGWIILTILLSIFPVIETVKLLLNRSFLVDLINSLIQSLVSQSTTLPKISLTGIQYTVLLYFFPTGCLIKFTKIVSEILSVPANTQRYLDVNSTFFECYRCQMNVKTTLCCLLESWIEFYVLQSLIPESHDLEKFIDI